MKRIARGAALLVGCATASVPLLAACGTGQSPGHGSAARLTAAVLSTRDLPSDFLPAEDQQVFGRLVPSDPDCRRLLDLADLRGLRDVPRTTSVFYRLNPGSTLAERIVELGPPKVSSYVQGVRRAAAACGVMSLHAGEGRLRLHRRALSAPGFGVRYVGRAGGRLVAHYDIVVVPEGTRLLVVAQPTLVDPDHPRAGEDTGAVAAAALRKLRTTAGTTLSS